MAKRLILFLAVVAFLTITVSAGAWFTDYYYSYHHQFFTTSISPNAPIVTGGAYPGAQAFNVRVTPNPTDDTYSIIYQEKNAAGVNIAIPDGFSYSEDIDTWLENEHKSIVYSIAQNDAMARGLNDSVIWLNIAGAESIVMHGTKLYDPPLSVYEPDSTLGMTPIVDAGGIYGVTAGSFTDIALADFKLTDYYPAEDARIYFSNARTTATYDLQFGGFADWTMPTDAWRFGVGAAAYKGSGYQGQLHPADIATETIDDASMGVFESAWKIAGTMLGDKFWDETVTIGTLTYKLGWNTTFGYVTTVTGTVYGTGEYTVTTHSAVKNFLRYVMDIRAMVVQDVDGDGKFDAIDGDKVMFVLEDSAKVDDASPYGGYKVSGPDYWTPWKAKARFWDPVTGDTSYFNGGLGEAIYIYDGDTVTTYMDASSNLFFGLNQSTTTTDTIWGGRIGVYDITGFDLTTYIPEPSTMILIIGTGLALGAGILRRKLR